MCPSLRVNPLYMYVFLTAYKDRLTMPKIIITAGSDEFFLPDDAWYYFDGLPEPKYLR